jgi:hypothetical protein
LVVLSVSTKQLPSTTALQLPCGDSHAFAPDAPKTSSCHHHVVLQRIAHCRCQNPQLNIHSQPRHIAT